MQAPCSDAPPPPSPDLKMFPSQARCAECANGQATQANALVGRRAAEGEWICRLRSTSSMNTEHEI